MNHVLLTPMRGVIRMLEANVARMLLCWLAARQVTDGTLRKGTRAEFSGRCLG